MPLTTEIYNTLLDLILGDDHDSSISATVYLALFNTEPVDGDLSGEISTSGTGYGRVAIDNNNTNWTPATAGVKANANAIAFGDPSGDWGAVNFWGLCSASSSGVLYGYGGVSPSISLGTGDDPVEFRAGDLIFVKGD